MHYDRARFNVWVCHRRFGKTVACVNELIDSAVRFDPASAPRLDIDEAGMEQPGRFAYIAPTYKQAKLIAWDYAKAYTRSLPGRKVNESELWVEIGNGSRIRLFGAEEPDTIRGAYLDGVAFDEYAFMNPAVFTSVVRPMLADRKGWAIFMSTVAGKNHFYRMYEAADGRRNWTRVLHRASQTNYVDPEELAESAEDMTEEEYAREYECDFNAPVPGAYFAKLLRDADDQGRITDVPWTPDLPVHTAWDVGFSDDTAIWFYQVVKMRLHVIDYYASNGEGIGHYINELHRKPYTYGRHLGPHDLMPKTMASGGRSLWEQAKSLGLTFHIAPQLGVNDGINAVRRVLPRMWFDAEKCADGLDALRLYRRERDEDKDGPKPSERAFKDNPLHDWTSHAADAMRYLAVGYTEQRPDEFPGPPRAVPTWNEAAAMIDRGSRRREWA